MMCCVCVCREEFEQHGLSDIITLTCQDVCTDGFPIMERVDAGDVILNVTRLHVPC